MHSLEIDAEHFIEEHKSPFTFSQNPFKSDLAGKAITFEGVELDEHLKLVADISTLRLPPWGKGEAFVIADILGFEAAPRSVLKALMANSSLTRAHISEMTF